MKLHTTLRGRSYSFRDLADLMAKANESKAGDRLAGLAASDASERMAARHLLAEVEVREFAENPAVPYEQDEVTRRILDGLDAGVASEVGSWTAGELRERILGADGPEILRWGRGLSSEAISAVARLMSNLDLVQAASRIGVQTTCRTTIGQPGTLASRLQPNHPVDDIGGILASVREGLSYGVGDAVVGLNPADDSVAQVSRCMDGLSEFVHDRLGVPTQICVLAHVTTQLLALERGARCDLVFQSIAGSEAGCKAFGFEPAQLGQAGEALAAARPDLGPNVLYFETGQGSELSSGAHHGADQLVMESRCYGLARCFSPFLVNSVVGFIGPEYLRSGREVRRAGLEDHFMGKVHGLPMGVDVCHTNAMDADQNDLEDLAALLTAAGCNFFMGVPLGDDVMLNYQTTSYHDIATLREVFGKRPSPDFEAWMERSGILAEGRLAPAAGNAAHFDLLDRNRP
jgi:ethanolamine ammonia-lyase large subunit